MKLIVIRNRKILKILRVNIMLVIMFVYLVRKKSLAKDLRNLVYLFIRLLRLIIKVSQLRTLRVRNRKLFVLNKCKLLIKIR